jgi:putative FmdB family regulatory protein
MPVYEYECKKCSHVYEHVFHVNDFPLFLICPACNVKAFKIISKVQNMKPDWEPYYDENLEAMVTGRGHRKELMKQQGLEERPLDPTVRRLRLEEREHKKRQKELKHGRN